jgi:hypothetical protein
MSISVYDMLGKRIEGKNFQAADYTNLQLGGNYPVGMYNVILNQATEQRTLRVIKRE